MIGEAALDTVIFDLGGVVLRWEPEAAFAQVLPVGQIPDFLAEISFADWNRGHDAGRPWSDGERELITRFPHRAEAIRAYRRHFPLAIPGMVPGTAAVLAELGQTTTRLLALTNWAADTFAETRSRFDVLNRFASIMVSGEEGLTKPDPAIFTRLIERENLDPARTLFVDDSLINCEAARGLGLSAWLFEGADGLRAELVRRSLLAPPRPPSGPVFHLVERVVWQRAELADTYPWSSRGLSYEKAGFVHCSFSEQRAGSRKNWFADVADADLVAVQVDLARLPGPIVVESGFPHLFGRLRPGDVTR